MFLLHPHGQWLQPLISLGTIPQPRYLKGSLQTHRARVVPLPNKEYHRKVIDQDSLALNFLIPYQVDVA